MFLPYIILNYIIPHHNMSHVSHPILEKFNLSLLSLWKPRLKWATNKTQWGDFIGEQIVFHVSLLCKALD